MNEQFLKPEEKHDSPHREYYQNLIEKEQEKLEIFFSQYLPPNFKPKNIIDFCCGTANEEPVLHKLYGEDVSLVSFDNSEHMIETAKNLNLGRKSIIKLDTKDIDDYFGDAKFDLLLGRNIPINPNRQLGYREDRYPDAWPQFLESSKKHLSDSGYLLITFAREDEFERAQEILNNLQYNIITHEKNKVTIPSDMIGIAGADVKDNYVIVAHQKTV